MKPILRLYPQPAAERPLIGTYLAHDIRREARQKGRPFVYTNYVTSIDGRIAIAHPQKGLVVPKSIANERDWRLFQELAFQADVLISSGRYLRELADRSTQDLFAADDPRFADLRDWRAAHNLPPHPAIAIVSNSLDFTIHKQLKANNYRLFVFTSAASPPARRLELESQVDGLFVVGQKDVDGHQLVNQLSKLGQQVIYNTTGPKVFHMLLAARVVDRLYLTHANRILGGNLFSAVVEGPLLEPAVDLHLNTIYFDPHAPDDLGQLCISYNIHTE